MTIRFGVVGCGLIADFHARALAETRGAKLVGCASRSRETADTFAKRHGVLAYPSIEHLMADKSIDAVCICTPSGKHFEPAMEAIREGKHVIIEKPLEISLRRCDQLIAAAERQGVVLSTVFQSRFHESSRLLKQAIEQQRFGHMVLADAYVKWFRPQTYYDESAWKGTWALDGGGALMNQAIHCVDLLLWLAGPVETVTAQAATRAHDDIEVEDVLVATLRFSHGALGVIEATTGAFPGTYKRIEIAGTQGSATLDEESITQWKFAKPRALDATLLKSKSLKTKTGGGAANPAAIGHHGHARQFADVVQAIRKGSSPLIDGHEARRSVEVTLAIYQAAQTGRTISLPLARDPKLTHQPFPG